MDCSMPGFPDFHHLWEFAQTQIHWVDDTIHPSHPLSPPFPALNLSQHRSLLQWVGSSHQVAKVLELHHQSPVNIQGWFPLRLTCLIFLLSKGLSKVFSSTTVRKHQLVITIPRLIIEKSPLIKTEKDLSEPCWTVSRPLELWWPQASPLLLRDLPDALTPTVHCLANCRLEVRDRGMIGVYLKVRFLCS